MNWLWRMVLMALTLLSYATTSHHYMAAAGGPSQVLKQAKLSPPQGLHASCFLRLECESLIFPWLAPLFHLNVTFSVAIQTKGTGLSPSIVTPLSNFQPGACHYRMSRWFVDLYLPHPTQWKLKSDEKRNIFHPLPCLFLELRKGPGIQSVLSKHLLHELIARRIGG